MESISDRHPGRRYLYVCEGITDEDRLKKLGCLFVLPTGGKFIRHEIVSFLKLAYEVRDLVLILDPDGPGRKIQERLVQEVGPSLTIQVEQRKAIKKDKVGIAQMAMVDLKEKLRPFVLHDILTDENLSLDEEDFYKLGLVGPGSKEKREKLIAHYHIPFTSAKKVEDCLLMLQINAKEIQEVLS